jgi:hypothetical protein
VLTQGPGQSAAVGGTLLALATVAVGVVLGTGVVDLGVSSVLAVVEARPVALPPAGVLLEAVGVGVPPSPPRSSSASALGLHVHHLGDRDAPGASDARWPEEVVDVHEIHYQGWPSS